MSPLEFFDSFQQNGCYKPQSVPFWFLGTETVQNGCMSLCSFFYDLGFVNIYPPIIFTVLSQFLT